MKILHVGDIVGSPGRLIFSRVAGRLRREGEVDFIIANAENAAAGRGITPALADEILAAGANVITLGDHVWDKREVYPYLNAETRILRPANFSSQAPGHGSCLLEIKSGIKIGVVVLLGRTFIKYPTDCPFQALDRIFKELRQATPNIIVDMHAEATSEKVAMGWYADGRVSAVLGTHTHIQTADEKILPQGTAFITDVGMTGPYDSVIGQMKERIVERYLTGLPNKFEVASGAATLCGVLVDLDETTGKARGIQRIQKL